jgi:hypothetical protein
MEETIEVGVRYETLKHYFLNQLLVDQSRKHGNFHQALCY